MNTRDLSKLLRECLSMNEELQDFARECLKEMFGEDATSAINYFNDAIDNWEQQGCICYSPKIIQKSIAEDKKRLAEWREKQKAKESE